MVREMGKRKNIGGLAAIAILGLVALPAFAGTTIPVRAVLVTDCGAGCQTDIGSWIYTGTFWQFNGSGKYSLLPDTLSGEYLPSAVVQSEILTHNTVYTLDTLDTLAADGTVSGSTRTVRMHLYTTASNLPPACWNGSYEQTQAVNWSIFSQNSTAFPDMVVGNTYPGFARLDFNVRNGICDNNIFRFYLRWPLNGGGISIKRLNAQQWEVTTDPYGTASLYGQGGRRGQTQYYGDWRMPFKVILTKP